MDAEAWRDRHVLVTGATGLLGGWLVEALLARGAHVVGLVRDRVPRSRLVAERVMDRIDVAWGDVTDYLCVERVLAEYEIRAVSAGEDAQGQVVVRCRRSGDGPEGPTQTGHGLSTNIIEASLEGYLVAVNKLHGAEINGVSVAFVAPRTSESAP